MADIRIKYVCRSAVALVETHYFGVPFRSFSVFWWHRETYIVKDPPPPVLPKNTSWYKVA